MSEESSSNTPTANSSNNRGVPAAIVVAGALIAIAIYFGGGKTGKIAPARTAESALPAAPAAEEAVPAVGNIRPVSDKDHIRGPANAKVTIITYDDIECPFCKRFHPTMKQLMSEYPQDARWVFRHFPLEQLHANARVAALASECAAEQGKFWETVDYMFEKTESGADLAESKLPALAQKAGVADGKKFTECLSAKKYNQVVDDDLADAAAAGGRGTPYSVVIGPQGEKEAISGAQPYEAMKAVVEKYL